MTSKTKIVQEIAKAVWEYKKEAEEQEELERIRFNECYDEVDTRFRKERGFWRWMCESWDNTSQKALKLYNKKYGKLKYKGDLEI